MTTVYKFKCTFTKSGAATAPSSAPTIAVVGVDDTQLVAALTATTALTNLPGTYVYSYSGADGLDPIGRFTTTDITMDQTTLDSYTSIETREILTDTGTTLDTKIDAIPTVAEIDTQLSTTHGAGTWGAGGTGGALSLVYTVNASGGGVIEGATVELYSDSGYVTLVDSKVSNVLGQVTFSALVAGTYYLKVIKSGYTTITDSEVVA